MANIDKKLAKKLAKMPEEERQAFLENLRLQEEENQRKKEELLMKFLKVCQCSRLEHLESHCSSGQAGEGGKNVESEPNEAAEPVEGHHEKKSVAILHIVH